MTVKPIEPEMLILEFRQEKTDKDYGSCLWARFYFNLERYELLIVSDCGNYGYKWYDGTKESFLQLMARIDNGYFCDKLCGRPNIFDYEATKNCMLNYYSYDEDSVKQLNEIFEYIDDAYGEPEDASQFIDIFKEESNGEFEDIWEFPVYDYSANQKKICEVFDTAIQPKIQEIVKKKQHNT